MTEEGVPIRSFIALLVVLAGTAGASDLLSQNTASVNWAPITTSSVSFTTAAPAPAIAITVAKDGSGDHTSVQEAFDAVPENYPGPITVFVRNGVFHEKLLLDANKINVTLVGESRDSTILTYDDYSGRVVDGVTIGTSASYSVAIDADDFIARDITFQNISQQAQAVALRVRGDRMAFYNTRMLGYQDTYYTWGAGRVYHKDCYVEGTTDFIFGRSIAVFDDCTIHSKRNSTITAASTEPGFKFGYIFRNATLTADPGITRVELGRPWRPYGQTVFMNSELGAHINPDGWRMWEGNQNHLTAFYGEYDNSGPGYQPEKRVAWSHQVTAAEAAVYTLENIFAREAGAPAYAMDWMPADEPASSGNGEFGEAEVPGSFELKQNDPNPYNPETTIGFQLPTSMHIQIVLFNVLGDLTSPAQMSSTP